MRIWLDPYATFSQELATAEGPVETIQTFNVGRSLDAPGLISFAAVGADKRTYDLLTAERRFRAHTYDDFAGIREIARGIIRRRMLVANDGGLQLTFSAIGALDELSRKTVAAAFAYEDETLETIINALLAKVTGWTADIDASVASNTMTIRMDGITILKALQAICEQQGIHFRRKPASKELEIGPLGANNGLYAMNMMRLDREAYSNDDIVFIESWEQEQVTEAIANRIIVFGAGDNLDAALTLEQSNRSSPYTIQTLVENGRTFYYIEDAASIALYGAIEKVVMFKDIAPLATSSGAMQNAANTLYDAAAAWLQRHSVEKITYSASIVKPATTITPGDKMNVSYIHYIESLNDGTWRPLDINDALWIMSVDESVSGDGTRNRIKFSNVDRHEETAASVVVDAIETIRKSTVNVQPTLSDKHFGPEQVYLDAANAQEMQLNISNYSVEVIRVEMRVRTRVFTSTARNAESVTSVSGGGTTVTSASGGADTVNTSSNGASTPTTSNGGALTPTTNSGGASSPVSANQNANHQHVWAFYGADVAPGGTARRYVSYDTSSGTQNMFFNTSAAISLRTETQNANHQHTVTISSHQHTVDITFHNHTVSISAHTHSVDISAHTHSVDIPGHTHDIPAADLVYGIYKDALRPSNLTIDVNGIEVVTGVGTTGADFDDTYDITDEVLSKVGGFQGTHIIDISCGGGQGEVLIEFDMIHRIIPIRK